MSESVISSPDIVLRAIVFNRSMTAWFLDAASPLLLKTLSKTVGLNPKVLEIFLSHVTIALLVSEFASE